jgi:glycine oxidase
VADRTSDVIVIGAGVAGCGVAWRLAARGVRVLIVERSDPGRGATWAAAGMLTPLGETGTDGPFLALAEEALVRWPSFAEELIASDAGDPGFVRSGRMQVANDAATADRLRRLVASPAGKRARAVWLAPAAARAIEPCLSAELTGAAIFPGDASADPRALGDALRLAALGAGARMRSGDVAAVRLDEHGVTGVVLRDGTAIAARRVIIAAGAWAAQLAGLPTPLPVRPLRGEMFALNAPDMGIQHIIWGEGCYVVPRPNGRILVGATVDDVGFAPGPTPAGIASLTRAVERICTRLAAHPLTEVWAGFRPGTPDGLPIIGGDPRAPGLFYVAGLFRNGILLAPAVADEVAALVADDTPRIDLSPFSPVRPTLA